MAIFLKQDDKRGVNKSGIRKLNLYFEVVDCYEGYACVKVDREATIVATKQRGYSIEVPENELPEYIRDYYINKGVKLSKSSHASEPVVKKVDEEKSTPKWKVPRECICGCGDKFTPKYFYQKYISGHNPKGKKE